MTTKRQQRHSSPSDSYCLSRLTERLVQVTSSTATRGSRFHTALPDGRKGAPNRSPTAHPSRMLPSTGAVLPAGWEREKERELRRRFHTRGSNHRFGILHLGTEPTHTRFRLSMKHCTASMLNRAVWPGYAPHYKDPKAVAEKAFKTERYVRA